MSKLKCASIHLPGRGLPLLPPCRSQHRLRERKAVRGIVAHLVAAAALAGLHPAELPAVVDSGCDCESAPPQGAEAKQEGGGKAVRALRAGREGAPRGRWARSKGLQPSGWAHAEALPPSLSSRLTHRSVNTTPSAASMLHKTKRRDGSEAHGRDTAFDLAPTKGRAADLTIAAANP